MNIWVIGIVFLVVILLSLVKFMSKRYDDLKFIAKKEFARILKGITFIYVPSYCLSHYHTDRLTDMSLQTTNKAIEFALWIKKLGGNPILILSTAYAVLWEREADIKTNLALDAGLSLENIIIIPEVTDSYNEARKVRIIIRNCLLSSQGSILFAIAERLHASRVGIPLRSFGVAVDGVEGVKARIERALEPSWIKSIRSANVVPYALWQWIFYLANPLMVWREKRKQKGG